MSFFSVLTEVWARDVLPPLPDPLRQRSGPQTRAPLSPLLYRWARERVKFRLGVKLQTYGNTEPDLLKNRLDNIQQLVLSARKKRLFHSLPLYVSQQKRKLLFNKREVIVLLKKSAGKLMVFDKISPELCRCLEKMIVFIHLSNQLVHLSDSIQ